MITELNDIDTSTEEGRLALSAISILWARHFTNNTPNEIILKCNELTTKRFLEETKDHMANVTQSDSPKL